MKDSVSRSRRRARPTSLRLDELCPRCSRRQRCIVARVTEHPEVSTSTGSPLKAEFKAFGMGDYVVRQGEPRTSLPVVCRGLVIVTTLTEAGDEVAFQACGLGEFVGLTDWLQGKETYSISGRALIESTVAFVKPEDLFDHAQTNREVLTALLEQIGFQTHALEHRLGWQTVLDASGRVVHSLLDLAGQLRVNGEKEVALPIKLTRTIIAEFAGLRRETVSRVLTQLQRKRLIRQHDRHIVIPSLSQLRKALRRAADSS